jgi:urease accessory protein
VTEAAALLAALQLGDSALPVGRFVHSHGVEGWLRVHDRAGAEELEALVGAAVCEGVAPLDGAVLAHAHRAGSVSRLLELDELLTARKLVPPARAASQAVGRQLAALAGELVSDPLVDGLAGHVRSREADGNLAVVAGAVSRALGLPARDALLVELRGSAAGLLSAAVRLGRLAPVRAQVALARLAPAITRAADEALALGLDELGAGAVELELCALLHARADARFFST